MDLDTPVLFLPTCVAGKQIGEMSTLQANELLSEPSKEAGEFLKTLKRRKCSYESHCQRFRVEKREFKQQYAHLYYVRLTKMRERVKVVARRKWGEG